MIFAHNARKRDDRGVVAIEFVLIFPLLMMMILAVANFGGYYFRKVDTASAARDAARQVSLKLTPYDQFTAASDDHIDITVNSNCASTPPPINAVVTATLHGGYTFSIPFINLGTQPITQTGTMRCGG